MARPLKNGLDYFPTDVDMFSDFKIKVVRGRYGSDGVMLYIYLLCEIYKKGFYLKWDSDVLYCLMADLNMSEEKTRQILNFLLERSLFNDKLFQSDKVLTAASIQRRYQEACKNRKRDILVDQKFWVLEKDETLSFIKMHPQKDKSDINSDKSKKNSSKSGINSTKESKVKESKVNDIKVVVAPPAQATEEMNFLGGIGKGVVLLSESQMESLLETLGIDGFNYYVEKLADFITNKNAKVKNHYQTILKWHKEDEKL